MDPNPYPVASGPEAGSNLLDTKTCIFKFVYTSNWTNESDITSIFFRKS